MSNPPIILKDDPEAFKALIRRAKKKRTLAQKHGRAIGRSVRVTEKGKRYLKELRDNGHFS
jgi:hypothetical protein